MISSPIIHGRDRKTTVETEGRFRFLNTALPGLLLIVYLAVLLWRFSYRPGLYLSFFTDDFFYYVEVARHLACCGFSSFNGIQPTNGYHPLWLLAITALYSAFGGRLAFLVAVVLLIWLLVAGTYFAIRRAQQSLLPNAPIGVAFALFSITYMAVLSRTGMEISLALFFLAVFYRRMAAQPLESQTWRQALISGLVASCLVLSRIDCCMIVFTYGVLGLLAPYGTRRAYLRKMLFFAIGLAPVAIYLAINHFEFHTLLPISGMAKNLKTTALPSASTIRRVLRPDVINLSFTFPSIAIAALYLLRWRRTEGVAAERVRLCVLVHPVLFYATLSFTSDWPIWTWYLYPLVPVAALIGPKTFSGWRWPQARLVVTAATAAVCIFGLGTMLGLGRLNPVAVAVYRSAAQLQGFAASHPGRYAMGDAAGTAAYLTGQPIIQMEGLMEDRPFLRRIQRQQSLTEALPELGVDYYVTDAARKDGACYVMREPSQGGPRSPGMSGRICAPPVADFDNHQIHVLVFDVRPLRMQTGPSRDPGSKQ